MALLNRPPSKDTDRFDDWQFLFYKQVMAPSSGIVTQTAATRTVSLTDNVIICNRAGIVTLTLPDVKLARRNPITVITITANTVVSATANVVPQAGGAAAAAILAAVAGKWADLMSDGTNWIIVRSN